MKRLFFVLIALVFHSCSYGQIIDRVNIYVIPFSTDYAFEGNINVDYVRVRNKYLISIVEKNHVNDIYLRYKSISKELVEVVRQENVNACRVVIDFIKSSEIIESVVIDKSYSISFDEPYSKTKIYKYDKAFLCYLNQNFPSIISINHKGISCSE